MKPDNYRNTNHRITQEPPTSGRIRDALSCFGLVVLFVSVVYVMYGFGIGGL